MHIPLSGWRAWTAALLLWPALGLTQLERLDDSASPRSRVQAQLDPDPAGALGQPATAPYATVRFNGVEYRLATARYAGRRARIFYVVPAFIPGLRSPAGMRVEWRSSGLFASGSAMPGERRLVWSGTVPGPWMAERFDLRVQFDLRELRPMSGMSFDFECYFEIEVLP